MHQFITKKTRPQSDDIACEFFGEYSGIGIGFSVSCSTVSPSVLVCHIALSLMY